MQLGFVIDHTRCIGCHACTVACKSENDVPLGDFRTWVKYTEQGAFPEVRRSFAVLRCNQCSDAPCVAICPVTALDKRPDGIVDVDPQVCIGCKACMHGCPYDALYLNERTGMAEKCHFCAHRVEIGLAPACAVVCPTEAIIPGDFDDPQSRVAQLRKEHQLTARKTEAGTGPNVFYREVDATGIDPGLTNLSHGFIWSQNPAGPQMDAQTFEALEARAEAHQRDQARTVYDVPRKQLWGGKITGYLFAKSLGAGAFPAAFVAYLNTEGAAAASGGLVLWPALLALLFISVTGGLLIADLKRPERFYTILLRPNWNSWLARGTFLIAGYSGLLVLWIGAGLLGIDGGWLTWTLGAPTVVLGALTAAYTGWLFAQAKGRVLWMKRFYWLHLVVQAMLAGAALLLLVSPVAGFGDALEGGLGWVLRDALALQLVFVLCEPYLAPRGREREFHRASALLTRGPYSMLHKLGGVGAGVALPLLLVVFGPPALFPLAGAVALAGLWIEEDLFVKAGQALPIS